MGRRAVLLPRRTASPGRRVTGNLHVTPTHESPERGRTSLQQLYLVLLAGGLVCWRALSRPGRRAGWGCRACCCTSASASSSAKTGGTGVRKLPAGRPPRHGGTGDHPRRGRSDDAVRRRAKVLAPAAALATVGVAVSMVVTAAGADLCWGSMELALLLGAVVSVTDAAAPFGAARRAVAATRRGPARGRVGFNDAPAVILVLMFSVVPLELSRRTCSPSWSDEFTVGAAIGLGCGFWVQSPCAASFFPPPACIPWRPSGWAWSRRCGGAPTPAGSSPRTRRGRARQFRAAALLGHRVLRKGPAGSRRSSCSSFSACSVHPSDLAAELVPGS